MDDFIASLPRSASSVCFRASALANTSATRRSRITSSSDQDRSAAEPNASAPSAPLLDASGSTSIAP